MTILNARTGSRANGLPASGDCRYGGSLQDAPEPVPAPQAFLRLPERVLAALEELGGSGTAAQIGGQLREWDAPAPMSSVRSTLSVLARRDPSPVLAAPEPGGGNGRPLRWRLAERAPEPAAARTGGRRDWLPWPDSRRAAANTGRLRRKLGMLQRQLGDAAGIGKAAVSQLERGCQRFTREQAEALAAALGTTFEVLTGELCAACGQAPGSDGCQADCGRRPS